MQTLPPKAFYTSREIATLFDVTQKTLAEWRRRPGHPLTFIKFGDRTASRIRYPREAVEKFIADRTNPTAPSNRRSRKK